MDQVGAGNSYNQRLFESGRLRRYIHNARFNWFRETARRLRHGPTKLVELGCFDGRLLDYCPFPVSDYHGFDANVEGGLADAQRKFAGQSGRTFTETLTPEPMKALPDNFFEMGASLETLEHIPPELVGPYLQQLARVIDGHLLITVPNEVGFPFLFKHLYKSVIFRDGQQYAWGEVLHAFLGNSNKVQRHEHKGFDYRRLADEVARYFDILSVENTSKQQVPASLGFTVGIVCKSRPVQ